VGSLAENKALVRRLVDEVVTNRNVDAIDELATAGIAEAARQWVGPFRDVFPDFRMEIVDPIAEDDKVVARFKCSGTHRGEWRGHPPTGRAFTDIDEIYIFTVKDGKLADAFALEDTLARLEQLGLGT
jgi:predicted ester cyclase